MCMDIKFQHFCTNMRQGRSWCDFFGSGMYRIPQEWHQKQLNKNNPSGTWGELWTSHSRPTAAVCCLIILTQKIQADQITDHMVYPPCVHPVYPPCDQPDRSDPVYPPCVCRQHVLAALVVPLWAERASFINIVLCFFLNFFLRKAHGGFMMCFYTSGLFTPAFIKWIAVDPD